MAEEQTQPQPQQEAQDAQNAQSPPDPRESVKHQQDHDGDAAPPEDRVAWAQGRLEAKAEYRKEHPEEFSQPQERDTDAAATSKFAAHERHGDAAPPTDLTGKGLVAAAQGPPHGPPRGQLPDLATQNAAGVGVAGMRRPSPEVKHQAGMMPGVAKAKAEGHLGMTPGVAAMHDRRQHAPSDPQVDMRSGQQSQVGQNDNAQQIEALQGQLARIEQQQAQIIAMLQQRLGRF